ncbi:MAG: crossover junction endodeoxyribonuclease RuvC [Chitinophagaceae bacterium]|nr:crossover junction endodeoxyribonuclease RuvC [Chitinophagaceae bacterium]
MQTKGQIILGIDPGTLIMGYGVILVNDRAIQLLDMNVVKLPAQKDHYERLHIIQQRMVHIITSFHPHHFAIEAPFYGKNVQSMLKLGRAQGVAIAVAMQAGIPVTEYSPRKVKQSITGNGNADKEQVWRMLQRIANITSSSPSFFDASDALAVAVCHQFQMTSPTRDIQTKGGRKMKSNWEHFAIENPGRIRNR